MFYPDKNCNETAAKIVSRINTCVIGGSTSTTKQCASPPASKSDLSSYESCQYTGTSCQGTPECKDIKFSPGQCFLSTIPAGSVTYICTYAPSTQEPNHKPDNKPVTGVSGGVVAAVILIPLVVIVVAVAAYIFIRKSKMSVTDTDTQTGSGQTSYGSV